MSAEASVLIIGAGIVGSALAHFLSSSSKKRSITVVDRSIDTLVGSTGHAPGFIGQYIDSEVLTHLARDSVAEYLKVPGCFSTVGGLEVAFGSEGIRRLEPRCELARKRGLSAEIITVNDAAELAPQLVKPSDSDAALHFPADGTADAPAITNYYRDEARKAGVRFLQAEAKRLCIDEGKVTGVEVEVGDDSRLQHLVADRVSLATGIWAQELGAALGFPLPVVPVGHPYMYGRVRGPLLRRLPFVRWPEHHAYVRDHGTFYGIGTYDHRPLHYKPIDGSAIGNWVGDFQPALDAATTLFPDPTREEFPGAVRADKINGIFSMTPDNVPLAGEVSSVKGLYVAVAVWVTHASGTAKFISKLIEGEEIDTRLREALDPERFKGNSLPDLERQSLRGYNDIYKTEENGP
ncbi:FAD dependent oxidoreductase [Sodiomyces alkalinus F11]|uniref:FAD dependent oxidoreductase n=1 Tax=Sodiomyces alkalinus (strain CBS 110278 / VKM F-3762 / F11) TaxID=1314773 RepID=A0A3N2Q706_SODAK|nr:FAD dependent oxidoreductase [Sodiomyces alkalinus F11]ROT42530.1 FAD dependent oxidoreductase [Sodiomyces alkalinus F11]